ncbi:hypothetical protein K3553_03620 [Leisingera aquaemixtae]|uniref:hypothetical protein n=1 Tax=Leisingera aquaemixtae TaxID=1396826 RepID=UPI0021A3B14F|nr:hypothetical protein [Leisingera aquaemixtae]UWQ25568.1 hypothetical protein K3553_03620 [Leisingera aquaemixtae]UWQ46488.1 hypothetical protein K3719_03745 [Leisingera aquaemixtae]
MNKTDFHLCGTCGTHLYLTGKSRHWRFFLLVMPIFFSVMVLISIAFSWLGWVTTEGPKKGAPTFGALPLMMITVFSVISAINGRREEVKSVKLEDGQFQ